MLIHTLEFMKQYKDESYIPLAIVIMSCYNSMNVFCCIYALSFVWRGRTAFNTIPIKVDVAIPGKV